MNIQKLKYKKVIVFVLCCSIIFPSIIKQNMSLFAASKGVCTATKLMIRQGPGQEYSLVKVNGEDAYLEKNQIVDILSSENGWYKIKATYNGIEVEGYSSAAYIKEAVTAGNNTDVQKGICTANTLMVRKGPGTGYDKINSGGTDVYLTNGQSVEILGAENGWYHIKASFMGSTIEGYSSSDYIRVIENSVSNTPTYTTTPDNKPTDTPKTSSEYELKLAAKVTSTSLNIRKTAGTSGEKIATLNNGYSVTVIGEVKSGTENWYKVTAKVDGKTITGYVLSDYVKITIGSGFYANVLENNLAPVKAAGGTASLKLADGSIWKVNKGRTWISDEITENGQKWFRIGQSIGGETFRGYVKADKIELLGKKVEVTAVPTPVPTQKPGNTPTPIPEQDFSIAASVSASSLNLRKTASTSGELITTLTNGTKLTLLNQVMNGSELWYRVSVMVNNKQTIGYVYASYIKLSLESPVEAIVIGNKINVRSSASSTAVYLKDGNGNLLSLPKETLLSVTQELTAESVKWYKVKFTLSKKEYSGYLTSNQVSFNVPKPELTVTPVPTVTPAPTTTPIPTVAPNPEVTLHTNRGSITNASALVVRSEAGYSGGVVSDEGGVAILLRTGDKLKLHSVKTSDGLLWYQVSFEYKNIEYMGYVTEKYINFEEPEDFTGEVTPPPTVNSDFEAMLTVQGFPESYKTYLRKLHAQYPNWQFEAYHTGLDWNTVLKNEGMPGTNLIPNSKGIEWKSLEEKAYNWKTDSFVVYDGSTWVTASKEAIAYYMDPRNFLDEKNVFQFEVLTYQPGYQNLNGVENILKNTALYSASYNYIDLSNSSKNISYAQTFIKAAEYSGVSPYHLASRVKQEVVTGTATLSNSVTGTVSGFEGLYNFYNIGAYHSTVAGGNIANGLKYAKNGSTNAALNTGALIPWDNQYKSIVGGAYIIGSSYINVGQDTIYLQKFNVTQTSTYAHQYMANVEAPSAEGRKVYAAYGDNVSNLPIVFSIPVYLNMPAKAAEVPAIKYNPNNWLSSLKVLDMSGNNLMLTPAFDISAEQEYYLVVPAGTELVNVTASAVSKKATVSGEGIYQLPEKSNLIAVYVVAENGDIKQYKITIVKESQ